MVLIEIDGKKIEVRQGQMIIEAADEVGISIPRFCYHKKLSIAANCRMCLVEVSNAPKALPACATPVSDGMKVFTTSEHTRAAQKAVMEFLLINHPLDCPICDQGGQCELQDLALSYGKDFSRYTEGKRAVSDKNIGPLISTEMTRCIHCTRCVRFGAEIAGVRELGATGRGEFMEIGTYVQKSLNSELSGNVIDLCPVGALTSKPFRFHARAWEVIAKPSIAAHDCVGSNIFFHTLRDKVVRALPRENEALNEVWLSDRDRFSYEAFDHADRLTDPWIRQKGKWEKTDWSTALTVAADKLNAIDPEQMGILASPNSTLEEFYLLQKLFRSKGCHHLDHRLRQIDPMHHAALGMYPALGISLSDLESQETIILIGSDIRKEQPLIAHRVRKAAFQGARVIVILPWKEDFHFPIDQILTGEGNLLTALNTLLSNNLSDVGRCSVLLGAYAWSHPYASDIYRLSRQLAHNLNATWGEMSHGANSAGGWLSGMVPHRLPFGQSTKTVGLSASEMWQKPRQGYFLMHCEPEYDCATPYLAKQALAKAKAVIILSAYDNAHFRSYGDVLLPVTPVSETSGTYVNGMGLWQTFEAAVSPLAESRPAWKVLRVLANKWEMAGFSYEKREAILEEIVHLRESHKDFADHLLDQKIEKSHAYSLPALMRLAPLSLYAVDGVTRRAKALQKTQDAQIACVKINTAQALKFKVVAGQKVWVAQEGVRTTVPLPVEIDDRLPNGIAMVAAGLEETHTLGAPYAMLELFPELESSAT